MINNLFIIFFFLIISAVISSVLLVLSFLLGDKSPDKEKVSVYECGFNPFHNPGDPFSIRFFLIAILFLVFDLEVSYLFPWAYVQFSLTIWGHLTVQLFLIILVLGLIYEWVRGGLEWE